MITRLKTYLAAVLLFTRRLNQWLLIEVALLLARLLRRSTQKQPIWLVAERADEARDNGYHFFRYLCQNYSEIRAIYAITKDSPDIERVTGLGETVNWGSFRHYLYWALAEVTASAHVNDAAPVARRAWDAKNAGHIEHVSVFLQHGVTAVQLPGFMTNNLYAFDMISTSTPRERQFLADHIPHARALRLTGFCRHDALHNLQPPKRQILLMPTWRREFRELIGRHGRKLALRQFRETEYYQVFDALLQSPALHNLLERFDYKLVFYLHSGAKDFLEAFSANSPRVHIAAPEQNDIQALLKESHIMITDYSSVAFEFVYMEKPLLYLLPDADFFDKHVKPAYFDLERDGLGPVTRNASDAVHELQALLERQGQAEPVYAERIKGFYPPKDAGACERTFQTITKMLKSRQHAHPRSEEEQ